jgi:hypothetical protein
VLTVGEGFVNPVEVVELAGPLPDGVFVAGTTAVNMELVEFVLANVELVDLGLVDGGLVDGGLKDVELAKIPAAGMLANSDRRISA